MAQIDIVKELIKDSSKTISEVAEISGILRPNIRRILGQGVKSGVFTRLSKGVYTLTTDTGEERAYIKMGPAQDVLPELIAEGRKYDMVFLDPAYFSRALIGGNRGIKKWDFITAQDFYKVMKSVAQLMTSIDSHVYLMLSGAPSAQVDMEKYIQACTLCGFKLVAEGKYKKLFKTGIPVTNVRGKEAAGERLILMTQSGVCRNRNLPDIQLNYSVARPAIKGNYQTQKSPILLDQLISQSTMPDESVADFFAGSGITGERALMLNRKVTLVEVSEDTIENYILPRIMPFGISSIKQAA